MTRSAARKETRRKLSNVLCQVETMRKMDPLQGKGILFHWEDLTAEGVEWTKNPYSLSRQGTTRKRHHNRKVS